MGKECIVLFRGRKSCSPYNFTDNSSLKTSAAFFAPNTVCWYCRFASKQYYQQAAGFPVQKNIKSIPVEIGCLSVCDAESIQLCDAFSWKSFNLMAFAAGVCSKSLPCDCPNLIIPKNMPYTFMKAYVSQKLTSFETQIKDKVTGPKVNYYLLYAF